MPQEENRKRLVCFIDDLIFSSKVEIAAVKLGYGIVWAGQPQLLDPRLSGSEPTQRQPAEHLSGAGAILIDKISSIRPAMIIFDLGNVAIPWRDWLPLLKSAPATRRYPVICYGSHVDTDAIQAAQRRGADAVFARSRFIQDLPELIQQYAQLPDKDAIGVSCGEELSPLALKGLALFNQGEYFKAHELLEEAWNEEQSAGRELYRAILQVAVAYLQIERGNYNGAVKMFWRLRQWIEPLPDRCRGVDVARLREDARYVYDELIALGKDGIGELDRVLLRAVSYKEGDG
jgi:hypothetical protein